MDRKIVHIIPSGETASGVMLAQGTRVIAGDVEIKNVTKIVLKAEVGQLWEAEITCHAAVEEITADAIIKDDSNEDASMKEFFIETHSFAAPFFSDIATEYVEAETAAQALETVARHYSHPTGLYSAAAYSSADAKHKGERPLATWLCNHELEKQRLTAGMDSYSYLGYGVGDFEINGTSYHVDDPRSGRVLIPSEQEVKL